jgi:hypothetical protein
MSLFKIRQSRSFPHRTYFTDVRTGKSQFGKSTFKNRKIPLPTDWVRLNTEYSHYYKYIGDQKLDDSLYYAPKLDKTIENATCVELKDLNTEEARIEIRRRNELFESIATILNMDSSDIRDESIEYLASKNSTISVEEIILHIEREESSVHAETTFRKIKREYEESKLHKREDEESKLHKREDEESKREDEESKLHKREDEESNLYISKLSLRDLVGLNSFFNEDDIMSQIEELKCPIGLHIMVDPVILTSGITYERSYIKPHLFTSHQSRCPVSKTDVDLSYLTPNLSLRAIIEKFYNKYKDQRGSFWRSLRKELDDYGISSSKRPINVELTEYELKYAWNRRQNPAHYL